MASPITRNGASAANSTKEPTPGDRPAAGDAAATGDLASRAKQALDAWQALEGALANISLHAQVFADVASAVDRHIATEAEIREKDGRIADLNLTIQNQLGIFEDRYSTWEAIRKELKENIEKKDAASNSRLNDVISQKNTEHEQELDVLKKALESEKKKSSALGGELAAARQKTRKAEEGFAKCNQVINQWNGYMSELKEVDFKEFEAKMKTLWQRCCNIASKYLFSDLPERTFLDPDEWDKVTKSLHVPIRFPPSNSKVAKNVRVAACLHITAQALCTEIFKPCFIPLSKDFSDVFKEVLAMQFCTDVSKERITRALVLTSYEDQKEDIDQAIEKTVAGAVLRISNTLAPLVKDEKFINELVRLFSDAADVWRGMAQHSMKMVEALTEDDFPNMPWDILDQFTISPPPSTNTASSPGGYGALSHGEMFNLFPRIYVPEDEKVVFSGVALLSNQGLAAAAENETAELALAGKAKTIVGSAGISGKRRMSIALEGKGRLMTAAGGEEGIQHTGQGRRKS